MEFFLTATDEYNLEEYCKAIENAGYPIRKVPRVQEYSRQRKFDYYIFINTIDQLMDIIKAIVKLDAWFDETLIVGAGYIEIYDDYR